jgi:uncharacterized protein (DUF1697 family)
VPRYVAFLRGVSPTNAKMPDLKRCFERAGFTDVKTVLASGNVAFSARATSERALERKAESQMLQELGRSFYTIVRSVETLRGLLDTDPYGARDVATDAKRVVTFVREPRTGEVRLPPATDGARIVTVIGREIFTVYSPTPKGPVFMTLIEKTFGKDVTTRTWETLRKCVKA